MPNPSDTPNTKTLTPAQQRELKWHARFIITQAERGELATACLTASPQETRAVATLLQRALPSHPTLAAYEVRIENTDRALWTVRLA